jgi:hypothetical protein
MSQALTRRLILGDQITAKARGIVFNAVNSVSALATVAPPRAPRVPVPGSGSHLPIPGNSAESKRRQRTSAVRPPSFPAGGGVCTGSSARKKINKSKDFAAKVFLFLLSLSLNKMWEGLWVQTEPAQIAQQYQRWMAERPSASALNSALPAQKQQASRATQTARKPRESLPK